MSLEVTFVLQALRDVHRYALAPESFTEIEGRLGHYPEIGTPMPGRPPTWRMHRFGEIAVYYELTHLVTVMRIVPSRRVFVVWDP